MKNEVEGIVVIGTGASFTVIDRELANFLGVEYYDVEPIKLTTLCCRVEGKLASIKYLEVEGKVMGSVNVVVTEIPRELKRLLSAQGFRNDIILSALDARGFVIDLNERKLKWVGLIFV